jgi:hypothetical protein
LPLQFASFLVRQSGATRGVGSRSQSALSSVVQMWLNGDGETVWREAPQHGDGVPGHRFHLIQPPCLGVHAT